MTLVKIVCERESQKFFFLCCVSSSLLLLIIFDVSTARHATLRRIRRRKRVFSQNSTNSRLFTRNFLESDTSRSLSLSFHLWYFQFSIFSSARRGEKRRNFLFFSLLSFFFRYMKIYWTRFWLCKALEMTQLWLIISTMDALNSDVCCPRAPTKHMKISGFQIEEFFLLVLYGRGETTFLLWLTFPFFFVYCIFYITAISH